MAELSESLVLEEVKIDPFVPREVNGISISNAASTTNIAAVNDPIVMAKTETPQKTLTPTDLRDVQAKWRRMGSDNFLTVLSAMYGKLLIVLGMAFPMSEVISSHIPHSFYEIFYLYLYIGSMIFLWYLYIMRWREKKYMILDNALNAVVQNANKNVVLAELGLANTTTTTMTATTTTTNTTATTAIELESESSDKEDGDKSTGNTNAGMGFFNRMRSGRKKEKKRRTLMRLSPHFGSFYLRMGAVAFGIGSMIYSGLEIGQYFELDKDKKCHNMMIALTPATRMVFIFIQMYFIFLNEEVRVTRHKIFSRFGLMHMLGTNLSVWLSVLIQETKHEIVTFYHPNNNSGILNGSHTNNDSGILNETLSPRAMPLMNVSMFNETSSHDTPDITRQTGPHNIYECRRTYIFGTLVQNASPFLFPCTIEYSLICAAILYVMWKDICNVYAIESANEDDFIPVSLPCKKAPHHYSVDCAQAHKGLFLGILFLVITIISLIIFFVLISKSELVFFAVMEVNICELALYGMSTLAAVGGMIQVSQLKFNGGRNLELDNILLIGAQTGIFIYSSFTIIGGHFTRERNTILVMITASASLIQTSFQTVFILDASRRSCATKEQNDTKPGRETITFLLVSNLAMWAINTLEKSRADSHPIQLHFYGLWAWTIITHVSMPLAIFYRFHSTVCLCEIWKRAYKMKQTY